MVVSLAAYLDAVAADLSPRLVSAEAFSQLRALACHLPGLSIAGFESRLADDAPVVDLAACATVANGGLATLAGQEEAGLPEELLAHVAWQRMRSFCLHWADPRSLLHDGVDNVWLEFDAGQESPLVLGPNVLFGLTRVPSDRRTAETGLQLLLGGPLSAPLRHNLTKCFEALPKGARISQVGAMVARAHDGARVLVTAMATRDLPTYLTALGWPGPTHELEVLLGIVSGFVHRVSLAVDVGAAISPKIGIECYLDERRRPELDARWQRFLNYLVAQGLCVPEKRDALLIWPGYTYQRFIWPSVFVRGLNHIKIVHQPGYAPEAKAYFGFSYAWTGDLALAHRATANGGTGVI